MQINTWYVTYIRSKNMYKKCALSNASSSFLHFTGAISFSCIQHHEYLNLYNCHACYYTYFIYINICVKLRSRGNKTYIKMSFNVFKRKYPDHSGKKISEQ